jgi:hypothetical protein
MPIALGARRSRETGGQTPTLQTISAAANGSAEEANQSNNMPKLPLLSSAYKDKSKTYNIPLLQSYAGYPVVSAKKMGLEDYYNKDGKYVAGMAWGGAKNPPGQGKGEAPSIIPNQNYFKGDPRGYNALVKLEASRHWMSENDYNPKFKITPEIQKWREKNFKDAGQAGMAYLNDDNALRQTIISRVIAGDENIPTLTGEALSEVKTVEKKLLKAEEASKPTISQSIMYAMDIKNKSMK